MVKMTDVKVGMRLRPVVNPGPAHPDITVTEITEVGFKYSVDHPQVLHARFGWIMQKDGHEHFGIDGEAFYEPVAWYDPSFVDPCDIV